MLGTDPLASGRGIRTGGGACSRSGGGTTVNRHPCCAKRYKVGGEMGLVREHVEVVVGVRPSLVVHVVLYDTN